MEMVSQMVRSDEAPSHVHRLDMTSILAMAHVLTLEDVPLNEA